MGGIMKKHVQRFFSILAIILFFVITYYMGRPLVAFVSEPGAFQAWVDAQGFVGVLLFLGMLVLQVFAAIIPGGPFEIAAGYAFGIVKGSLICAIGTTLGSMVVFFLVRRFGHKFLHLFVEDTELEKLTFLKDHKKMESILFLLFLISGNAQRSALLLCRAYGYLRFPLALYLFCRQTARHYPVRPQRTCSEQCPVPYRGY